MTDRDFYQTVLQRDFGFFRQLTAGLADEIVRERFDFALGDASEGEILTHDLWRGVINAAVTNAERRLNRSIASFQFALEGPPQRCDAVPTTGTLRLVLDDAALARKVGAARAYPELKQEVEDTIAAYGEDAFRLEAFSSANGQTAKGESQMPRYERHGEELVGAGIYTQPVRYSDHVAPILSELERWGRVA